MFLALLASLLASDTRTARQVLTVLLDGGVMAQAALASYAREMQLKHAVVLAGPNVRAGYVPRLVLLDGAGRVRIDAAGGVISVQGLVQRVRPWVLLAERLAPAGR